MTAASAIRFLDHEGKAWRAQAYACARPGEGPDVNRLEALLLLLTPIVEALELQPMDDVEASAFRHELKMELNGRNAHA